jgi:iron complex outermembrane receptor protein
MRDGFRFSGALVSFAWLLVGGIASAASPTNSAPHIAKVSQGNQGQTGIAAGASSTDNRQTSSEGPAQLQEVIVTATLRSENARNVPAALTVLSGAELDQLGAQDLDDVAALVPGLQLSTVGPGFNVETLRGISTGLYSTGATVATYFEETPTTAVSLSSGGDYASPDPDLFDVQRVEVLKGPQGTLFGASAMGGVIRYIFNRPDLERFEGKAEVGFEGVPGHGSGNTGHLVLNIPMLKDTLAIRLEGFRLASPGFIDNVYRNQKNVNISLSDGGRAEILWAPSEAFSARLSSYYQRMSAEEPSEEDVQPLTLQPTSGDLHTAEELPEPAYTKLFVNNVTLSYDFPWATLLSSTSLQQQFESLDSDASDVFGVLYGPLFGINAGVERHSIETKKTTEEVRLTSPAGRTFDWIAGFYYTHEAADELLAADLYNASPGAAATLVYPGLTTSTVLQRACIFPGLLGATSMPGWILREQVGDGVSEAFA